MSAYDFQRIANMAFVHAAEDILREQGRTSSFSRVSAITGLHRHVVSSISRQADDDVADHSLEKDYHRNRMARVLAGWHEGPDYTDEDGRPRILPVEGPPPSFISLVKSYSGDIYPKVILDQLTHVGAVRLLKDGCVKAVARRYTLGGADPMAVDHLGDTTSDLLSTLEHNLDASDEDRLFEDDVVSVTLDAAALPLFRQLMKRRGAAFLDDVQGWLSQHEGGPGTPKIRAGVSVHMFVGRPAIGGERRPGDESKEDGRAES